MRNNDTQPLEFINCPEIRLIAKANFDKKVTEIDVKTNWGN
ncbi:hypothetical protein F4694_001238 [Bacillus niacini]|uniref:Uncharacterized protein n=1 Tax=Neobacillus niacini TaxID=86668 RepID=A0A852TAU8_9BACI|nr:hypothetical protein [Neobacillus niacini]